MIRFLGFLVIFAAALGARIPVENELVREEYIVGGTDADIKDFPYQVSLVCGIKLICGGSILSQTHILTSAHCITSLGNTLKVRAGSSFGMSGGAFFSVKKITRHPRFSRTTREFDVAVLELETPLQFNETVKPIKVTDREPSEGESVTISGWGSKKEGGPLSYKLQSVAVPVVGRATCRKNYEIYMAITPRMICAGSLGKGACEGDTGGPLVRGDRIVGVMSTGRGCGLKDFPGVFTNLADPNVRKFIRDNVKV